MSESIQAIVEVLGPSSIAALVDTTNKIAVVAGRELGIDLTPDEIVQIESVKLAVLADMEVDYSKAMAQLRAVPSVAARLTMKEDAARVAAGHAAAVEKMSPQQRMTYARQHGLTGSESAAPAVDHAHILSTLSGQTALNYARKHGLA